jgi:hypothetical protein
MIEPVTLPIEQQRLEYVLNWLKSSLAAHVTYKPDQLNMANSRISSLESSVEFAVAEIEGWYQGVSEHGEQLASVPSWNGMTYGSVVRFKEPYSVGWQQGVIMGFYFDSPQLFLIINTSSSEYRILADERYIQFA